MRKERKIVNTNIRLNLSNEADRMAWNYLQSMDRKKYKSYTKAVVAALNDYFEREYQTEADPYLETREKENAFLQSVENVIRAGAREVLPEIFMEKLYDYLVSKFEKSLVTKQENMGDGCREGTELKNL